MEDQEILEAIGRLIAAAHKDKYPSRRQFAIAADIDVKTITSAEGGKRELHPHTQRRIEQALGWRKGSIEEVWAHRDEIEPDALTVEDMERGAGEAGQPLVPEWTYGNMSQFHTEEIAAELMYRIRNYKEEIARLKKQVSAENGAEHEGMTN